MRKEQTSGHIRALDGIRGFAFIAVFAYHSLLYTIEPTTPTVRILRNIIIMGWSGVDLFFVLSGFLITTILLNARQAENYFRVFYTRRALRIFPLYYLVLFTSLVFCGGHFGWKAQIFYWLNLSNLPTAFHPYLIPFLAHFWSLAIEEQFYFIWPALVKWIEPRRLAYICLSIILSVFLIRNTPSVLQTHGTYPELIYRLTPFRLDTLCSGALLAILLRNTPDLSLFRPYLRAICCLSGLVFGISAYGKLYTSPLVIRFGYTAFVVLATCLVTLSLNQKGLTSRLFSNSFLRLVGRYSYCLYLLHPFLINFVAGHFAFIRRVLVRLGLRHLTSNQIVIGSITAEFGILLLVCAISWKYFESPILALKKHFRYIPAPQHHLA
jgi:peptidoglycan/LPS O-acetylase OafA/YrhL